MRRHETETRTKRTPEEAAWPLLRLASLAQRPTVFSFTQHVTTHLYVAY
jgi:hypothetical protein